MLPKKSFFWLERQHRAPAFCRGDQRRILPLSETRMKETGAPQQSARLVAALRFFQIKDFALTAAVVRESGIFSKQHHAQDRLMFACRNFVAFAENRNPVFAIGRVADGMFVRSEMDRRSKLQPRTFVRRQQPIADVNGVLAV